MPSNGIKARVLSEEERIKILEWLCDGMSLSAIARKMKIGTSWMHKMVKADPLFAKSVEDARAIGVDTIFEQLLTVADDYENPLRARVKMECILNYARHLKPDKYGDKLQLTVSRLDINVALTAADQRLIDIIRPVEHMESAAEPELIELNKVNSNS